MDLIHAVCVCFTGDFEKLTGKNSSASYQWHVGKDTFKVLCLRTELDVVAEYKREHLATDAI